MSDRAYENTEAWATSLRLAGAVGRLKIASNLRTVSEAQDKAFGEAGRACALLAEASTHEAGGQVAAYRDARGALAQCQAWLHVIAELTNEPESVFEQELSLADLASRQIGASIRAADMRRDAPRPPAPGGQRPMPGARQGPPMTGMGPRGTGPRPPRSIP